MRPSSPADALLSTQALCDSAALVQCSTRHDHADALHSWPAASNPQREEPTMRTVREYTIVLCLSTVVWLFASRTANAQDPAITNVRIIVGSGQVIESGTIIVRG